MAERNNTNDPLERFFQDKMNRFEIEFHEDDWKDMENRLEKYEHRQLMKKQRSLARKRFAVAAAVLLFLSLLAYFTFQNYSKINDLEQRLSNRSTAETTPGNTQQPDSNDSQPEITGSRENESETSIEGETAGSNPQTRTSQNNLMATQQERNVEENQENDAISVFSDNSADMLLTRETELEVTALQSDQNSGALQPRYTVDNTVISSERARPPLVTGISRNITKNALNTNSSTYNTFSRFTVGIHLAPDFSSVGSLFKFYTPGYKLGALMEYNLSRNFGIAVGLNYSGVNYSADGDEYDAPYGFFTDGIIPEETLAECAILAIPIRVKFNFAHLNQSRFYVTAGISSYIMLDEAYEFNYARTDEAGLVQHWDEKTGTRHWLSNATLSIGYEFDLNQNLSLRVEPYLNIPVRRVGWGKVKLYSTGSFISLNYHFQ